MVERDLTTKHGMITVTSRAPVHVTGTDVVLDFTDDPNPQLVVCGRRFDAAAPEDLAASIRTDSATAVLPLPLEAHTDGLTLVLRQPAGLFGESAGAHLSGAPALLASAKAERLAPAAPGSWLPDLELGEVEYKMLDGLVAGERWEGPLVVSMPRTGSTLLGMLFLLLRDPAGHGAHVFDRYIHEPAAPLYWQGRLVESIDEIITEPLTPRDIIQESAYQFANRSLARWFLHQARKPIVFTVRHPQLAWPSRWRIMLRMRLEQQQDDPDRERISAALRTDDFSGLGDILTDVSPPDNGWLAMLSLIQCCLEDGLEFVVVDNGRFREDPEAMLRRLCDRLGVPFHDRLTTWSDLSEVRDRVVMGELARGEEYDHYYRRTLDSASGIQRHDRALVTVDRFPGELRGQTEHTVTIDEAVTWYHMLLARPEAIRV